MAHHDHMADHVKRRFLARATEKVWPDLTDRAEAFAKRVDAFVSAYDPTVVCADCNEVDAKAKRQISAPSEFSFAPADIRNFIKPLANRSHAIDPGRLRMVWEDRKIAFELRIKIIDRIVEIALRDEHWFQPTPFAQRPEGVESLAKVSIQKHARMGGWEPSHPPLNEFEYVALTATRLTSGANKQTWRKHAARSLPRPVTDAEVHSVSRLFKPWDEVQDDWRCPCCNRAKRDIIQPSAQSKLSFKLDRRFPSGSGRTEQRLFVCNECGWAIGSIAKEAGVHHSSVSFHDVRDCILPQQNGSHRIRADSEVDIVIERIRTRASDHPADTLNEDVE